VTWLPWRKRLEQAEEALRKAEVLRNQAQEQQRQVERITPRVDAVSTSLEKLRTDNHFGPLIEAILRGN
jgi:hypothetical protein